MNKNNARQNRRIDLVGIEIIRMSVNESVTQIYLQRKIGKGCEAKPKHQRLSKKNKKHVARIIAFFYFANKNRGVNCEGFFIPSLQKG
jgi:hypothetical protein